MTDLSSEMMYNGVLVELEKFRIASGKMGVDFDKLQELAESCLDEELIILKETLDKDPKHERKALTLDLEKILVAYPPFSKAAERSSFLNLQQESSSLLKILSNKKETFRGLSEELAGDESWTNLEDIIRFTPSPQHPDPQPES